MRNSTRRPRTRAALGSVRQIYNSSGLVIANKRYDPFGNVVANAGVGSSIYGFTGEQFDASTGLEYLRARYYAPSVGRFTTRDVWDGDPNAPMSYDAWNYTNGNPVKFTDASGLIAEGEATEADNILAELRTRYAVIIAKDYGTYLYYSEFTGGCEERWLGGAWKSLDELRWTQKAIINMVAKVGGEHKFRSAMRGPVNVVRLSITKDPFPIIGTIRAFAPPGKIIGDVDLPDSTFVREDYATYGVVHELSHVWDRRSSLRLSSGLSEFIGTKQCVTWYSESAGETTSCWFDTMSGKEPPTGYKRVRTLADWKEEYAATNTMEDWADSVASIVYPDYYGAAGQPLGPLRRQYVQNQIQALP